MSYNITYITDYFDYVHTWLQLGNTLNIHNDSVTEKCSNIVNMAMISVHFLMAKYIS